MTKAKTHPAPAAAEHRQWEREAELIAAILEHPEISNSLQNTLAQTVIEIAGDLSMHIDHPEIIRYAYPLMMSKVSPDYHQGLRNALLSIFEYHQEADVIEEIRHRAEQRESEQAEREREARAELGNLGPSTLTLNQIGEKS